MTAVTWVLVPVDALVADPSCAALPPDRMALHPFAASAADDEPSERIGGRLGTIRTWTRDGRSPIGLRLAPNGLADY